MADDSSAAKRKTRSEEDGLPANQGEAYDFANVDPSTLSKADKRAHHNALERKRRDHIKDSFTVLRDSIPAMTGEKVSRAQILNKATDYIQYMVKRNEAHRAEMEELKRQNEAMIGPEPSAGTLQ